MQEIMPFLTNLLAQVPLYIVWVVGIVLAVSRWSKQPKVSLYCLIAFGLLFFQSLLGTFLNIWLTTRHSMDNLSTLFMIKGFFHQIVFIIAFIFILLAIFSSREKQ